MRLVIYLLAAAVAACYGATTIPVPSTGAGGACVARADPNWKVVSGIKEEPGGGAAAVVDFSSGKAPGGWLTPAAGACWIAPASDQSNATRPGNCCQDKATYTIMFQVDDPTTASVDMMIAGDEVITMFLNSTAEQDTNYTHIVYSTDGPTFTAPVPRTIKNGDKYLLAGLGQTNTVQYQKGVNFFTVEVLNFGGGPTGLYINVTPAAAPGPGSYTDAGVSDRGANATPDPVDSGSGQFYTTETDFRLGGPMALGFQRYYGSQLSKSGVTSALGSNWMTTYDVAAIVNGTKAQVLLLGGRVVTFNNSAGAWQLASPLSRGYQFATLAGGAGFKFMDPASKRIYTFSAAGALTKIEDRNGNAITVTPGAGGPSKVADGLGRTLTFTYSNGQLTSVADQGGRTVSFTYSGGLLASTTDNLKAVTNYAYTTVGAGKGLLTKETLPAGNAPVSQTYDANGRVIAQIDGNNNTTKLDYGPNGATNITDANNNLTGHKNDDAGDIAQITDPAGGVAAIVYDSGHRRTSVTGKSGGTTQYVYDPQSGYVSAITDANGNTTSFAYTAQVQAPFTFFVLSGITYPDGTSASMTYDPSGNLLTVTAADGGVTRYSYESHGWLTKITDPMGRSTAHAWNADGTKASDQFPLGNTLKFEYDNLKRLSKSTDPNGSTASYVYDGGGRMTSASAPGQPAWTIGYNANGQRSTLINPAGAKYVYAYTATGKIATSTDPLGNVTKYGYDKLDRLSQVTNGAGEAVTYSYDAAGNISTIADNSGTRATLTHDAEGRLTAKADATGLTFQFGYDKGGRRTSVTSPAGRALQFTYDALGRVLTKTNAGGDQYAKTYDALGRLLSVTGPGGVTTSFTRDASGKPASFTSANGNQWTYGYDGVGRMVSIADPVGNATKYTYTGMRLTKIDYPLGSATYTYDTSSRPSKIAYSDGTAINKTYNMTGFVTGGDNLTVTRNPMGLPTNVNGIAITIDGAGKPLTYTYAAGKAIKYSYDAAGRVSSISDWVGGTTAITYDVASRRLSHAFPNGVAVNYGYDGDGHRNSIAHGTLGSIQLTFDVAGRTTAADRNLPIAPTLQASAQPLPTVALDTMGRVTSEGSRTYTWNLATQLTGYADTVNSAKITYDAMGEINSSTAPGVQQNYVFNYTLKYPALQIVRQGGKDVRYFVYMPDGELLYSIDAATNARQFYHFDEMGNTVFLTDDSGAVTDSYGITPYGELADHIGTSDNPFTWQGQYGAIQEGDGLYYMRSRHYDAAGARFLSPDPLMNAEPQTSEPYAYARSNPLMFRDAFGADAGLPADYADLIGRWAGAQIELMWGTMDPDYVFLSVALTLVSNNPDWDFATLMQWAQAVTAPPPPPPPDPPAIALLPPPLPDPQTCGTVDCQIALNPSSLISQGCCDLMNQSAELISQGCCDINSAGNGAGLISQGCCDVGSAGGGAALISQGCCDVATKGADLISQGCCDASSFVPRVNALRDSSPPPAKTTPSSQKAVTDAASNPAVSTTPQPKVNPESQRRMDTCTTWLCFFTGYDSNND